jgi:hypothetical protein
MPSATQHGNCGSASRGGGRPTGQAVLAPVRSNRS